MCPFKPHGEERGDAARLEPRPQRLAAILRDAQKARFSGMRSKIKHVNPTSEMSNQNGAETAPFSQLHVERDQPRLPSELSARRSIGSTITLVPTLTRE